MLCAGIFYAYVISDTHGLVRPCILQIFQECDLIIHAGDIGKPVVLDLLKEIAPVVAVRGNIDKGDWAEDIPLTGIVKIENRYLYVLHDLGSLDLDPKTSEFHVIISGHSHKPAEYQRNGVLYLNPGSAGPGRFNLPVCAALMEIDGDSVNISFINLLDIPNNVPREDDFLGEIRLLKQLMGET